MPGIMWYTNKTYMCLQAGFYGASNMWRFHFWAVLSEAVAVYVSIISWTHTHLYSSPLAAVFLRALLITEDFICSQMVGNDSASDVW